MQMIGFLILAFLAARIYRSSKDSGRNAIFWTALAVAVYVGVQLFVGFALIFLSSIGQNHFGWKENVLDNFVIPISFLSIILSLVAVWTLANYLSGDSISQNSVKPPDMNPFK